MQIEFLLEKTKRLFSKWKKLACHIEKYTLKYDIKRENIKQKSISKKVA